MKNSGERPRIEPLSAKDALTFCEHLERIIAGSGTDGTPVFHPLGPGQVRTDAVRVEAARTSLKKPISEPEWRRAWAVREGDRIVGHIELKGHRLPSLSHRTALGIGIEAGYRRKGYGEALMKIAIGWAKTEAGLSWIDLKVLQGNEGALGLYRRLRFVQTGFVADQVRLNEESIGDFSMALDLRPVSAKLIDETGASAKPARNSGLEGFDPPKFARESFELIEGDDSPEGQDVASRLRAFNDSRAGEGHARSLNLVRRDANGAVQAGLFGRTSRGWLHVAMLWVSDTLRGQGVGSTLLAAAESEALHRGCTDVYLDTFSFQAPGFYARLGYREFGVLEDYPPGHRRHFLAKKLVGGDRVD